MGGDTSCQQPRRVGSVAGMVEDLNAGGTGTSWPTRPEGKLGKVSVPASVRTRTMPSDCPRALGLLCFSLTSSLGRIVSAVAPLCSLPSISAPGRAKAGVTPCGVVQGVDCQHWRGGTSLENHLSNPSACGRVKVNVAHVHQEHLHLAAIVRVDDTSTDVDAVLDRQARAGGDAMVTSGGMVMIWR